MIKHDRGVIINIASGAGLRGRGGGITTRMSKLAAHHDLASSERAGGRLLAAA